MLPVNWNWVTVMVVGSVLGSGEGVGGDVGNCNGSSCGRVGRGGVWGSGEGSGGGWIKSCGGGAGVVGAPGVGACAWLMGCAFKGLAVMLLLKTVKLKHSK